MQGHIVLCGDHVPRGKARLQVKDRIYAHKSAFENVNNVKRIINSEIDDDELQSNRKKKLNVATE